MPPLNIKINPQYSHDGSTLLDLREHGINLIYLPDYLTVSDADSLFGDTLDTNILAQHSYTNRFGKTISPKRLVYAHVPERRRYRCNGHDVFPRPHPWFSEVVTHLGSRLVTDNHALIAPNASVSNGYRYNGVDYIAPHTDDEKFLQLNNSPYWDDSTVYTFTLLRDQDKPMSYNVSTEDGRMAVELQPRHGSLLIQGSVIHSVSPVRYSNHCRDTSHDQVSRVSITLRGLQDSCKCSKITCPSNMGPSNYVYYSIPQD